MTRRAFFLLLAGLVLAVVVTVLLRPRRPDELARRLDGLRTAGLPATLAELAFHTPRSSEAERQRFLAALTNAGTAAEGMSQVSWIRDGVEIPASQWKTTNVVLARRSLELMRKSATELHGALATGQFRLGIELDARGQAVIPRIFSHINVARGLRFERQAATLRGDGEAVVALTVTGLRLADALSAASLIEAIGSQAAQAVVLKDLDDALGSGCLDVVQLAALRRELESRRDSTIVRDSLRGERLSMLALWPKNYAALHSLVPQGNDLRSQFMVRAYFASGLSKDDKVRYFDLMQQWIEVASLRGTNALAAQPRMPPPMPPPTRYGIFSGKGFSMLDLVVPRLFSTVHESFVRQTELHAAGTATALLEFRLKHDGRLPESLDELRDVSAPPTVTDPVSEQPLHYRPLADGFLLYGVGPNAVDNQGTGDDVVFEVKWWRPDPAVVRAWSEAEQ